MLLCISDAREHFVEQTNTAYAEQQIALRSLIGDARRAIAQLAAAEGRLLSRSYALSFCKVPNGCLDI